MRWFLKRFRYTRELESAIREKNYEIRNLDKGIELFKGIIDEYRNTEEGNIST